MLGKLPQIFRGPKCLGLIYILCHYSTLSKFNGNNYLWSDFSKCFTKKVSVHSKTHNSHMAPHFTSQNQSYRLIGLGDLYVFVDIVMGCHSSNVKYYCHKSERKIKSSGYAC